jgi:N-acetylglutamate synthase-like GNAT family acetyltransferase
LPFLKVVSTIKDMKVIDLDSTNLKPYLCCLEEWSDEIKEAGDHKADWYKLMKEKGLRVKLAEDDGIIAGMIQYLPVEHTHVEGKDLYFIYCIWIHGYKEGIGNFQKQGLGKQLLAAAEEDAKTLGAKGIAAWGVILPFWMKASWFRKRGYRKVDKDGVAVLLWKSFSDDAEPPRWIRRKKKPETVQGQVTVTAFRNGWCPAQNVTFERAKRASMEMGDRVVFKEMSTLEKDVFEEWGITDAVFIDDRLINSGPPPSYEKIKKKIQKPLKRLK